MGTGIKRKKRSLPFIPTMEYYTGNQKNESDFHVAIGTDIKTKIWRKKKKQMHRLKTPPEFPKSLTTSEE